MSASNLCCTQPQARIDSPEPPSRPLTTIDGIFAAAVLPEDHPDAPKFSERKAETDPTIVQSPSITSKIRLQFQRRSVKNLKKEKEYDEDAHAMTLQEVLKDIEDMPTQPCEDNPGIQQHRFGSVTQLDGEVNLPDNERHASEETTQPGVRASVLKTLGYLQPLLQKPSDSGESYNLAEIATRVADRPKLVDISSGDGALSLPKSISTPMILSNETNAPILPLRSRSEFDLGGDLFVPKQRNETKSDGVLPFTEWTTPFSQGFSATLSSRTETPTLHVQQPTSSDHLDTQPSCGDIHPTEEAQDRQTSSENHHYRLHAMDIQQQLRSMSQTSDIAEDDMLLSPNPPWSLHVREGSDLCAASKSIRHPRQKSSSGMDSSSVPLAWGRVCSPVRDMASSVYSRPVSAAANASDPDAMTQIIPPYEISNDLNSLFADWPLKPSASIKGSHRAMGTVSTGSARSDRRNKPLPPTPAESRKDSGTASFVTATNDEERSSVRFLSPPRRQGSIPSKSSSSTLTKASKQSRFLEQLSPPKKTVKKRRSIFKFLRPGSRKQQIRSISSPVLGTRPKEPATSFDGPSEDPALLTVQYELTEQPNHMARSRSMSHLGPAAHQDLSSHLTPFGTLQRRPTLADYERNLSVIGDDRRRPSAVNIQRAKEIQEEDRRESTGLRRKISRARPLKDDASPLMAQALEKHQQEKSMFRSASKQRDSLKEARPIPEFSSSPFDRGGSSLPPPSLQNYNDLLDPLEKGQVVSSSQRSIDFAYARPPGMQTLEPPPHEGPFTSMRVPSAKTSSAGPIASAAASAKKRIGTSLDSWSRYPSHTREERCGSAGRADAVLARDFAVDINPEEIHGSDETEADTPESKRTGNSAGQHSKASLPRTRSTTFSGILRYYSNLFQTRGFQGQNRRTSVTTGGRLEYPELEMLPPQLPPQPSAHPRHSNYLTRLKEHVIEDADKFKDYVKEEEDKLEGYMKKEEGKLEEFVREEETKLESFVMKEEGKFKEFVKEEEDKWMHHHRHSSSEVGTSRKGNPFRAGSIFETPSHHRRSETMIAPNDSQNDAVEPRSTGSSHLMLDGTTTSPVNEKASAPSKAEVWSDLYRDCLNRPISPDVDHLRDTGEPASDANADKLAMPPPALKPVKPRTPEKATALDPKCTIRRFPSVTVIDDRKGHFRSVSLISVKTSKSTGFERTSTHDLLELIQAREREEREKLLKAIDVAN